MTPADGFVDFLTTSFPNIRIFLTFYDGKFQEASVRSWLRKTKNITCAPQANEFQQMTEILEPGSIIRFDTVDNVITECSSSL